MLLDNGPERTDVIMKIVVVLFWSIVGPFRERSPAGHVVNILAWVMEFLGRAVK